MIANDTFLSFQLCRRKAHLKALATPGEPPDIVRVQLDLDRLYLRQAQEDYVRPAETSTVTHDPPSLQAALSTGPKFIINATAAEGDISSLVHLLERAEQGRRRGPPEYTPVLFVRNNKLSRLDKLLVAFNALALAAVQHSLPRAAKIVHGDGRKVLRVKIEPLVPDVRRVVDEIRAAQAGGLTPAVTLNRHCISCEFRYACRKAAEETDDLSLLRVLSEKEVEKLRGRGITTVTQLSHSYRPGRRGKQKLGKARKHDPALQALAVREKKVYVLDGPQVPRSAVALYLDVESVPDRDFFYLIGLVAVRGGGATAYSFWADGREQEASVWDACARVIEASGDYTLYHYGSYEQRFLDRMAESGGRDAVERIRSRSCNVLACLYSHVYFPVRSNGLKDVAGFLGASWSHPAASGLQALAWRLNWEVSGNEEFKQQLLRYNQEDCLALRRVTEFLLTLGTEGPGATAGGPEVACAQDIRPEGGFRFGKTKFVWPELAHINRCAYSDYQRERVYVRTCPALRRRLRLRRRPSGKRPKVNVRVECPRPVRCPECGGGGPVHLFGHKPNFKYAVDLKYTASGVKSWVTRYRSARYRCWSCKATFLADAYRAADRLGDNLVSWAVYHHIALRQSYEDVNLGLSDLFGLSFGYPLLGKIMSRVAEKYQPCYERLKDRLRQGSLVHADETKVLVHRRGGYVWAFANMEEVVYAYSPTREGAILGEVLRGFRGVLVSDFYSAYDSVECPQQKCLIHLMRDVNDDLFHNPFDEELKQLGQRLVAVLKPIIDTIDRYGLRQYHLHKHKADVTRYFRYLSGQTFGSEPARKYQKRMLKYRDRLFVFLDRDGVPWNNNNAENAIKHFVCRRRILGPSFGEKGMQHYLMFFSLYQTCRNKGVSFLRFLRSGSLDIDAFAGRPAP